MSRGPIDKRFDFANRHFKGIFDTLNAGTAIERAMQLAQEAAELKALFAGYERPQPWRPIEFPSYYIIGLVTCLEWHARSRLYDLLRYDSANFTADDLKHAAAGSNLEALLRKQLTVAQLVAASTLVSDFHKYLGIFDRILTYLGTATTASEVAKVGPGDPGQAFLAFETLFTRRHRLVHEIDQTQLGPWHLREPVSLDKAEELGNAVIGLMTRIEHAIAAAAKGDFPNLIHPDEYISRSDRLLTMITDIEERILKDMLAAESVGLDIPGFEASVRLSREYLERERGVMLLMTYPGFRNYEIAEPLLTKLCEARLSYLIELEKQLHEHSVIIPKFLESSEG